MRLTTDWVALPAVAVLTVVALLGGLELAARALMPEQLAEPCQTRAGPVRGRCTVRMKAAEGPWTTVAFNACGSRSVHPCEAPPAGERVVVVGSSISRGYAVKYKDMFSPRAEAILDRACGAPVEFQNLALRWPKAPNDAAFAAASAAARAAVSLHPKAVLLFVNPWDLSQYHGGRDLAPPAPSGLKASVLYRVLAPALALFKHARDDSRLVLALRHFMNRPDQAFADTYMRGGDEAEYLRPALSPAWRGRIAMAAEVASPIAAEAERAGARFALVFLPHETDVLLARHTASEANTDPFTLPRALAALAADHGWGFIDTLPAFLSPGATRLAYYRINGHPNAGGGRRTLTRLFHQGLARRNLGEEPRPAGDVAPSTP